MNSTVKSGGDPSASTRQHPQPETGAADRQLTFLLVALTAAIYLRTVAPDVLAGDAGQFHFTAWRLGVSHPTGYPTYHLVGHLWQNLLGVFNISPAWAMNALSGIIGALSLGLLYTLMRDRLPTPPGQQVGLNRAAALFTALIFGWNITYWSQNLIAEVYTLHVVFLLAIFSAAYSLEKRRARGLVLLAAWVGLGLTHHGMTLLVIPPLLLYLFICHPTWMKQSIKTWLAATMAGVLPLLIYFYIPLRAGPGGSPWYHQRLGTETLTLYGGDWNAFIHYITGQSISVGFNSPIEALNQLAFAFWLWRFHFTIAGLFLVGLGLFVLFRSRNYAVLTLTGGYAVTQQLFNLFYNIEDILVYYIPLYLVGAIWAGFGAYALATAAWRVAAGPPPQSTPKPEVQTTTPSEPQAQGATLEPAAEATPEPTATDDSPKAQSSPPQTPPEWSARLSWIVMLLLFLLPLGTLFNNFALVDQSHSTATRQQWEAILAAEPQPGAMLASNDRDELVGLFYMQWVEDRRQDLTGLFPLIAPDERFTDIGATLSTALAAQSTAGDPPVYLFKEMPGLEIAFRLEPSTPPLIQVLGKHTPPGTGPATGADATALHTPAGEPGLGPLLLVGYEWHLPDGSGADAPEADSPPSATNQSESTEENSTEENSTETPSAPNLELRLHWLVRAPIPGDYTTTVQLFDAAGERIAQHDAPPGGLFYPTSHWKTGEHIIETHPFVLDPGTIAQLPFSTAAGAPEGQTLPGTFSLLIGMYRPGDMEQLASPIEFSLP